MTISTHKTWLDERLEKNSEARGFLPSYSYFFCLM
jgi:hypothetical protein